MSLFMSKCPHCLYVTNSKYNLKRHVNAKHPDKYSIECIAIPIQENTVPIMKPSFVCTKCNKKYKDQTYLNKHEKKCSGVDILTCPKCMISFSSSSNKSHHMKRNTCIARSIIHARSTNIDTINNITNNITNDNRTIGVVDNRVIKVVINTYGSERLDYLSFDKMLTMFQKGYNIPSALTEEIHFNEQFPENMNIQCKDKSTALIMKNGKYKLKDIRELADELLSIKSSIIQHFAHINKNEICKSIDNELYEEMLDLVLKLIIREPFVHYNKQLKKIIDLIKNNHY